MTTPADDWDRKCEAEERIANDIWFEIQLVRRGIARHLRDAGQAKFAEEAETLLTEDEVRDLRSRVFEFAECKEADAALDELVRQIERVS